MGLDILTTATFPTFLFRTLREPIAKVKATASTSQLYRNYKAAVGLNARLYSILGQFASLEPSLSFCQFLRNRWGTDSGVLQELQKR